ncbi:MAG TPA: HD domain-containing phosphohydrolase [Candidatus Limnocylindrales bacterium]|nr:HD domain-containing phosphohydrolase [Candidatus Limnocylindrales bacterium]
MLPPGLRDARVLLVDDQALNLRVLREVLERAGLHDITTTQDPYAVEPIVAREAPDLIVVDLHMPGLDGFGVMATLRPHLDAAGYLPILVLTGDASHDARRRALEAGALDFLTKPIDAVEVVLRTRNLLETRMLYVELQRRNAELERRVRERTAEAEAAQLETLERLARTAEYRDDQTGRHVVRVGRVAAMVARELELGEDAVRLIRLAAPLHDLGKIRIADSILLAPRALEPDELEEMKQHTVIGSRILAGSSSSLVQLAERIAMTHHERWDGRGYHGLVADETPLAARIVSIADVFDALTHERPYKEAWEVDRALEEIHRGRETQFDPLVTDAFERLVPGEIVEPAEPGG